MSERLSVAIVGCNFGACFIPIYQQHPDVEAVALCDSNPVALEEVARRYRVRRRYASLDEVLRAPDIAAVHLVTPPTVHAEHSIAVLESGRHCACTIPMAMTLEDLRGIIAARRRSGKNYMMMETAVYTREFLFVKELVDGGELGRITFARGAHLQDMEGWPAYWTGFPPHVHITHAFAPVLALLRTRARKVHCLGSGTLRDDLRGPYGNRFPFETAIFRLSGTDVAAEVSRFMFQTARPYTESFAIYGDRQGFEWQQLEQDQPLLFTLAPLTPGRRGRGVQSRRIEAPDRQDLLPPEIARFTRQGTYSPDGHESFHVGGGHGGAHPHLVHEFVRSILENRKPRIDDIVAADWTASGICAHASAMADGAGVEVPRFDE